LFDVLCFLHQAVVRKGLSIAFILFLSGDGNSNGRAASSLPRQQEQQPGTQVKSTAASQQYHQFPWGAAFPYKKENCQSCRVASPN
jgi:hypothetical protein